MSLSRMLHGIFWLYVTPHFPKLLCIWDFRFDFTYQYTERLTSWLRFYFSVPNVSPRVTLMWLTLPSQCDSQAVIFWRIEDYFFWRIEDYVFWRIEDYFIMTSSSLGVNTLGIIISISFTCIIGVFANAIVIVVTLRKRDYAKSATNIFIINLAISDIILSGVTMPLILMDANIIDFTKRKCKNLLTSELCFKLTWKLLASGKTKVIITLPGETDRNLFINIVTMYETDRNPFPLKVFGWQDVYIDNGYFYYISIVVILITVLIMMCGNWKKR